ncbi:MAG: GNAT family N-acetyltransferase [Oscillospiraceae bacterium]|jgi:predicted acetyltransferase|nr:GNAT family N-acetyltransferase [Oscillospiraceae bacterium]
MIIRYLTPDDILQSMQVSSSAFIWKMDENDLKEAKQKRKDGKIEPILGAFCDDDKTLMAQIEVLDFENNFCGTYLKSSGIGGVATKPEFRRGGAVRALFNAHFAEAKEKAYVTSLLYPFSYDYYRLFGYERICRFVECTLPYKAIAHVARNCDVKLYEGEEKMKEQLLGVYDAYARKHNHMFRRTCDDYFYKKPYEQNEYTYLWFNAAGEPKAYVSYTCDRPASAVHVKELLFTDYESLYGMLGFLRVYDGNFETLHFMKLPEHSPVFELITEHKYFQSTLRNSGSVRIFDLKTLLEANSYPETAGHFSLYYPDDCMNKGCIFEVEYQSKKAQVALRTGGEYDLYLAPAPAARLTLGGEGLTEERLQYIGGIEVKTTAADFLRAFPARPVDFYEGF